MKNVLAVALVLLPGCVVSNAAPPPSATPAPDAPPAPAATPAATPAPSTPAAGGMAETELPAEAPNEARASMADGRPKSFKAGAPEAFWVWQDAKGTQWHLRSTTKNMPHRFHGAIVGDGELKKVASTRTEAGDRFKLTGGKRASFDFATESASDGLDFEVANDSCVRFVLFVDGKPAPADKINLGKDAVHPQGSNFKLCS